MSRFLIKTTAYPGQLQTTIKNKSPDSNKGPINLTPNGFVVFNLKHDHKQFGWPGNRMVYASINQIKYGNKMAWQQQRRNKI